jgi:single-stranded DNA-specific DHH superfamily exonuclease
MFWEKANLKEVGRLLSSEGKKILIYHRDVDGVCSAALVLKFFRGFETIPREGPIIDKKFFNKLAYKRPDVLLFLDIPADQEWKKVLKLKGISEYTKVLIIDHHIFERNMNSFGMIHINPRFERKEIYMPASCVVYKILETLNFEVKPFGWICMIGVIGDHGLEDCKDILRKEILSYPHETLVRISEIISSVITLKGLKGAEKTLDLLVKSKTYKTLESSERLNGCYELMKREIARITKDFERNKKVYPEKKLIFYEVKSKLNITSIIASVLAEKYPNDIIIIRKKSGRNWKVSLRCESGERNVGDLAKLSSRGIGSGGGHTKSAGAYVRDWEEFKRRIVRSL